ncbi:MAG: tectonin domain-containing protein [Spirochaetales bacterium]
MLCTLAMVTATPVKMGGYNWLDIAIADDGTVLACNTSGDLYLSTDKGANFTQVEGYNAVRVSMNSAGPVMAHVNKTGDLYYSSDSGKTWTKSNAYDVVDVCATKSIHFHVNTSGDVYASEDTINWTKTSITNETRAVFDGWKLVTISKDNGEAYVHSYKSPTNMVSYKTTSYDFVDIDVAPDGVIFAVNKGGDVYTAPDKAEAGLGFTQDAEVYNVTAISASNKYVATVNKEGDAYLQER